MTATGKIRGRPVYWDGEVWRYLDTEQPGVRMGWS